MHIYILSSLVIGLQGQKLIFPPLKADVASLSRFRRYIRQYFAGAPLFYFYDRLSLFYKTFKMKRPKDFKNKEQA